MRKLLLLLPMWAIVSVIISCTQDSVVDVEMEKQVEALNAITSCGGFGACLPDIVIRPCSTSTEVQVILRAKQGSVNHQFDFYCQGGGSAQQSSGIITFMSWNEEFVYSYPSADFISYSITCRSCPLSSCVKHESVKINNGQIGETVSYKECFKQYKNYVVEPLLYESKLVLRPTYSADINKIMDVNSGRIYVTDDYGTHMYSNDVRVVVNDTTKIVEVYGLPLIMGDTIEVRLYNNMGCPDNDAHYISVAYTYTMTMQIQMLGLTEVDRHGTNY